ncbi:hypothetical protein [Mycobacterium sp.]|uniref:hypothetical protein n=1 Tax=Mycobacterium sp. TaxID=1785 RepID=UPI003BAD2B1B
MRNIRWMKSAVVVGAFEVALTAVAPVANAAPLGPPPPPPFPPSPTAPCNAISPFAVPCIALNKGANAVSFECRRVGVPDRKCVIPLGFRVTQAARDAYLQSWVHQTAQFQYALADPLPLVDAQWLGTHNSFNSLNEGFTVSHFDSNQQLSLTQLLDVDMRSLELDLHYIRQLRLFGKHAVTVCHGQGPEVGNLGCTTEPLFSEVLPKIATWLNAPGHTDEVVMLYLEDNLDDTAAYASTIATLDRVLQRPDGSSLIFHPDPVGRSADGCVPLPLQLSRDDVRASGARVVLVGSCARGWSTDVFEWSSVHVEGGSTSAYQPYPACDATYSPTVYASKLVRYFEDSTLVSVLAENPTRPPVDPEALTPPKVQAMTNCGVNLFGFDQLLPDDGRIQASLWSWAPDEPRPGAGTCTLQRADSRWVAAPCGDSYHAACLSSADTWTVTPIPTTFAAAPLACSVIGAEFALPRTGLQNAHLHAAAGPAGGAWVRYAVGDPLDSAYPSDPQPQ